MSSPRPELSNLSSHTLVLHHSNPRQLKEELVVKNTISYKMESPHNENDLIVKSEPGTSVWSTTPIKEEKCYDVPLTNPTDGIFGGHVKSEPGSSTGSSGQILGQVKEELVVKVEMESPQKESDHEINDKPDTEINMTCSDVKNEAEDNLNIGDVHAERMPCRKTNAKSASEQLTENQFKCSTCSKCFPKKRSLTQHMYVHTKPFSCSICNKCFGVRSCLKAHMLFHSGERPFKCSMCTKSFSRKTHLTQHESSHYGVKSLSCPNCGKCFNHKSHLTQHMFIHSGEKPISCSMCSKCFSRQSHLKSHMLVHSGELPFSCSICGKCFSQKSNFTRHMLSHP